MLWRSGQGAHTLLIAYCDSRSNKRGRKASTGVYCSVVIAASGSGPATRTMSAKLFQLTCSKLTRYTS